MKEDVARHQTHEQGMNTSSSSSSAANRMPSELNEQERQLWEDYEWCLHNPAIQAQYNGQVVAVHRKKVWGRGGQDSR
jgi:hypothetical protein